MKKNISDTERYFFIRPCHFYRYGELNIDGKYEKINLECFDLSKAIVNDEEVQTSIINGEEPAKNINSNINVEDKDIDLTEKLGYIIIKVPTVATKDGSRVCADKGTEIFTGAKFNVYDDGAKIKFSSTEAGLFMDDYIDKDLIKTNNTVVSGRLKYLREHPELLESYCTQLKATMDVASHYYEEYERTFFGPDKKTIKDLRHVFKKF